MSFCPSCGNQLNEGAKFCQNCGKTIGGGQAVNQPQINNTQLYQQQYQQPYQPYAPMKNIVQQLSGKIKVQAIIWLVIACIQYVLGIVNIVNGIDMYYDEEIFSMIMGILIIIVAVLNTVFSIQSFTYSTKILTKQLE